LVWLPLPPPLQTTKPLKSISKPVNVSGLQIGTETFNAWLVVDKDLPVIRVINDDEIAASVTHKEQGNDVGFHDEDEVEHSEERVPIPVTKSEGLNANNTLKRARHRSRLLIATTCNNLEHIMMVSITKKKKKNKNK